MHPLSAAGTPASRRWVAALLVVLVLLAGPLFDLSQPALADLAHPGGDLHHHPAVAEANRSAPIAVMGSRSTDRRPASTIHGGRLAAILALVTVALALVVAAVGDAGGHDRLAADHRHRSPRGPPGTPRM